MSSRYFCRATCVNIYTERRSEMKNESDQASNPRHYNSLPVEPIEFIMLNEMEFWRGNIIKYAARAGRKPSSDETDDLKKIIRYAQFRINQLEGRTPQNDGT